MRLCTRELKQGARYKTMLEEKFFVTKEMRQKKLVMKLGILNLLLVERRVIGLPL